MSQATLSVRLDSTDKKHFEEFCNDVGLNISTAVNLFVKAVIQKQRIPFEIERDSNITVMKHSTEKNENKNREYLAMIDRGLTQMNNGGGKLVTTKEMEMMLNE